MFNMMASVARKVMSTESEWNPKVFLGRFIAALLPETVLHRLKRRYYSYLLANMPDSWHEADSSVVRHLVRAGDSVLDIGASIGGYTRILSEMVGPSGHVYSFEPNPPIYEYLSYNVSRMELMNVHLHDCALSDTAGTARIVIPRYRWGSECHYDATLEANRAGVECRHVDVSVRTLDSVLQGCPGQRISFLKCDVNYHELACLRGAMETLRNSKPAILIEILPNPDRVGGPASAVFELLTELGYTAYWFDGQALHKRQIGERSQNYFFLMPESARLLPSRLFTRAAA